LSPRLPRPPDGERVRNPLTDANLLQFRNLDSSSHGHHIGDRALREVAAVLRSAIRPYDICVRYAGDEFIVVLSGCGQEEAERKRGELQRAVDQVIFEARPGRRLPIAISVGAAIYPQDGESYEALLATADSRMYRDKTRRKQQPPLHSVATGTEGRAGSDHVALQEPTEIDIQRATIGLL
jgi:diguanylate cyclase (GGDEF)-like protein